MPESMEVMAFHSPTDFLSSAMLAFSASVFWRAVIIDAMLRLVSVIFSG